MGTLIAWVLVRDWFPGKRRRRHADRPAVRAADDRRRPGAAVAVRDEEPGHVNLAYTGPASSLALLFVTLPFVVRTVQPVLLELDRRWRRPPPRSARAALTTFRRIILPNLLPAMLAGTALAFARAISEFGSTVLHLRQPAVPDRGRRRCTSSARSRATTTTGAAAVSTVLLVVALIVLVSLDMLQRSGARRG